MYEWNYRFCDVDEDNVLMTVDESLLPLLQCVTRKISRGGPKHSVRFI